MFLAAENIAEADPPVQPARAWPGYAWALAGSVAISLAMAPLRDLLDLANIVMLFLLGTVLVAMRFGRGPAALAACLNVGAFDFFFVPPRLSFAVSDVQYLVTFAVMLAVGLLTGQLTAGLRFQARVAVSRERRAQSLFALTRGLSAAPLADQVAERGADAVRGYFGGDALVLASNLRDRLPSPASALPGFDFASAQAAFEREGAAGVLARAEWHYLPLRAPLRVRGVLALRPAHAGVLALAEHGQHLDTMARQIAIALERVHFVEVAQRTQLEMESERLRNALLASMSHDIRTPLTALIGMAESLRNARPALPPQQAETAAALLERARGLAALVNKLLEMARLQSGTVHLRLEWQSVEEVVGAALRHVQPLLGAIAVRTRIPADLPLVEFDATLIERVVANLVENAARHGAGPIEIAAEAMSDELVLVVRDHGRGLGSAAGQGGSAFFEKFRRGASESARSGVGLGLAICKAVVDAHRGSITARDAEGGGAEFTVRLPRATPPQLPAFAP
jgi:two-component system, OmpR family, sensor histidine kinase KdpD